MKPHREETDLATELRELRPTPRPDFIAELDARAATGFPGEDGDERPLRDAARRLSDIPRWRLPALAGAVALTAIAIATMVIAVSEDGDVGTPRQIAASPESADRASRKPPVQFSAKPPVVERATGDSPPSSGLQLGGPAAAAEGASSAAAATNRRASGPNAFLTPRRDVERSAQLVLATEPAEVRGAAARVFETVHRFDGIVLRSSISAGDEAQANAVFELLIPSGRLGDALAGFSEIAEVRSRRESTGDVTGRTTGLGERLRDSRARIESLLSELAGAETEAERSAVESELRFERGRLAALRSSLQALERRVNLSRVSLRIESGAGAGDGGNDWGVADALDDAGRILAIAAGVTLIGLAVLTPLALIAALVWLSVRAGTKRRRESALG
ncbi:MAG TPA: DUF4349 domain-containing protein [Solirubrobacterales bacterium]|nr:DUF4349 domain-containing protein [Solirubrobacterales bacterium]